MTELRAAAGDVAAHGPAAATGLGALLRLYDAGAVSDEVLRRIERDLDLEALRMEAWRPDPVATDAGSEGYRAQPASSSRL